MVTGDGLGQVLELARIGVAESFHFSTCGNARALDLQRSRKLEGWFPFYGKQKERGRARSCRMAKHAAGRGGGIGRVPVLRESAPWGLDCGGGGHPDQFRLQRFDEFPKLVRRGFISHLNV